MTCMKASSAYDCSEKLNQIGFKRLPAFFQLLVKQSQQKIQEAVEKYNPGRKIRPTSGFRSVENNIKVGGVADSLHIFGLARDFRFYSDESEPFKVPDSMICIKSTNCWHVQYKRGI